MPDNSLIVLCTCPPGDSLRLANLLVDEKLAACVNRVPAVTSVYRWQGERETATEDLLIIKTTRQAYPQLEATLRDTHPYKLPEIIAVPIEAGLTAYLAWVNAATTPDPG